LWGPNELRFGGYLPANSTYIFVGVVDGQIAGARVFQTEGDGVNIDGAAVPLDRTYEETHSARIIVFEDSDRNGEFDRKSDHPCTDGNDLVETLTRDINFSKFDE
jgi:hypothetical protein